jgi:hypothetical protein
MSKRCRDCGDAIKKRSVYAVCKPCRILNACIEEIAYPYGLHARSAECTRWFVEEWCADMKGLYLEKVLKGRFLADTWFNRSR